MIFPIMPYSANGRAEIFEEAMAQINSKIAEVLDVEVDDSNVAALTESQLRTYSAFRIVEGAPSPDADVEVSIPSGNWGILTFINETAQDVYLEVLT